jgi:CRP-like cAMP-binding protein
MSNHQDNHLLAMLPAPELEAMSRHLTIINLQPGEILAHPGDEIRRVYFLHSGIVSYMVEVKDGHMVQTAMVGRDGVVGAAQALDDRVSLNRIIVQLPSTASVLDRNHLREANQSLLHLRSILASNHQFFLADIQQTAACNALHDTQQRMCRWMLRMHDLVGKEFPLTQEALAAMIGVRRTSVSMEAAKLQTGELIHYGRGHIKINDTEKLKQLSCECYQAVRENYTRLFGAPPPSQAQIDNGQPLRV